MEKNRLCGEKKNRREEEEGEKLDTDEGEEEENVMKRRRLFMFSLIRPSPGRLQCLGPLCLSIRPSTIHFREMCVRVTIAAVLVTLSWQQELKAESLLILHLSVQLSKIKNFLYSYCVLNCSTLTAKHCGR